MNSRLLIIGLLSLALGACATSQIANAPPSATTTAPEPAVTTPYPSGQCHACGHVVRIDVVAGDCRTDGSGAAVGGVVGGVLGNQGNQSEGGTAATPSYDIRVQMDDGRKLILNQRELGGIAAGSYVDIYDNRAHLMH